MQIKRLRQTANQLRPLLAVCRANYRVAALGGVTMALVAYLAVVPGYAQFPKAPRHDQIMERKLQAVQDVMEGIARSDFEQIKKESQSLHLLSREAGWNVLVTPTYLRLSEDFRATVDQLDQSAEKKNLDAVGLAYVKLSISCIECHRYARKEMPRIGSLLPKTDRFSVKRR